MNPGAFAFILFCRVVREKKETTILMLWKPPHFLQTENHALKIRKWIGSCNFLINNYILVQKWGFKLLSVPEERKSYEKKRGVNAR